MKLSSAPKRLVFAGLISAMSFALTAQAWAQPQNCPRPNGRGDVPQSAQRVVDNQESTPADLAVALSDCSSLRSLEGRMCAGTARLRIAQSSPSTGLDNFRLARCDFYAAAALASRARDTNALSRANGRAAEAVLGMRAADPSRAGTYDEELLQLHGSVGADFPQVHREVAQLHLRRGQANLAESEAVAHLRGGELAQVLITVALTHNDANQRRATLERALAADGGSIATNTALGEVYFNSGQTADAERLFRTAIGLSPQAGQETQQERAYHYLSVLEANRNNLAAALSYAERAGNGLASLRQNCLVRLRIGGEEVFRWTERPRDGRRGVEMPVGDLPAYRRCVGLGSSPEGQLLAGMFWLRRSQYRPAPTIGTQAEADYHTELAAASRAFDAQANDTDELEWPGLPVADVKVRDALTYGRQMAVFFDSFCRSQIQPSRSSPAAQVFGTYGIVTCNPS